MPHVIIKLWPGKSGQQKERLAQKIVKDVMEVLNYGQESVSAVFEELRSQDWKEKVYKPGHKGQVGQALQQAPLLRVPRADGSFCRRRGAGLPGTWCRVSWRLRIS